MAINYAGVVPVPTDLSGNIQAEWIIISGAVTVAFGVYTRLNKRDVKRGLNRPLRNGFLAVAFFISILVLLIGPTLYFSYVGPGNTHKYLSKDPIEACDEMVGDPDDLARVAARLPTVEDQFLDEPKLAVEICRKASAQTSGMIAARLIHEEARARRSLGQYEEADNLEHVASDAHYEPAEAKWAEVLYRNNDNQAAFDLWSDARKNSRSAEFWLGEILFTGLPGVVGTERRKEGISLVRAAASAGEPNAKTHECVVADCP